MNHKMALKNVFGKTTVTKANAKRKLHCLLAHHSVAQGSPVAKVAREYFGAVWDSWDDFTNDN